MNPTPINPQLLLLFATLAAALPPIVDEAIKQRVASAKMVALYTLCVGLFFGGLGALCTKMADGATFADAGMVALTGLLSGLGAGLANWIAMTKNGPTGGAGQGGAIAVAAAKPSSLGPNLQRRATFIRFGAPAFVALFFVLTPTTLTGCKLFQPGSPVPADIENDYDCVVRQIEAGQTNVLAMAGACGNLALSTVIDIVDTLLASPSFVASHPAAIEKLHASLGEAKAKLATPAGSK